MWKPSAISVSSKFGITGGERSGSWRQQSKNGRSGLIEQPDQDRIRQLWETAMDGVESSAREDMTEEFSGKFRTSVPSDTSSSSSAIARCGKLLEAVKRKVNLSSATRKAFQNERSPPDARDSNRSRNSKTQDEDIVSEKLLEELETLRRKSGRKEKEMQRLKNEVSTLRITQAIRSVQPQPQPQSEPQAEAGTHEKTSRHSFESDPSHMSCLDFSPTPSTGDLKFEGEIKTRIAPASKSHAESCDQQQSILSDDAAVGAPLPFPVEEPSQVNEVLASDEKQTKASGSSQFQEPENVDKPVFANKKLLDETWAGVSDRVDAARFSHHTGGGLELPAKSAKEELYISTRSYDYRPEEEFFDTNAKISRSPPQSGSVCNDDLGLPMMSSDSENSFLQKATSLEEAYGVFAERYPCDLSDVEVHNKPRLTTMKDGEGVNANALTVPLRHQTTPTSSLVKEDPLKVLMKSCVMVQKTMTNLRREESSRNSKHPDFRSGLSIPSLAPRRRREQSLTTAKHSDPMSRTVSVLSPPWSRPVAARDYPNRFELVSRQPLDWQVKAGAEVKILSNTMKIGLDSKTTSTSQKSWEGLLPILSPTSRRGQGLRETGLKSGVGELDLEEEVRQILEQSRMLLLSDESGNADEHDFQGSESGDKPFSVLALLRHRRSMVKNRPTFRLSPETNQHQKHEEKANVLSGVDPNIVSSKVDRVPEPDADQKNEILSLSSPPLRPYAKVAPYNKGDLQLVWELEVQNTKNQILSSRPRRSGFFFEANIARNPEAV